jgi:hypothetical protein
VGWAYGPGVIMNPISGKEIGFFLSCLAGKVKGVEEIKSPLKNLNLNRGGNV